MPATSGANGAETSRQHHKRPDDGVAVLLIRVWFELPEADRFRARVMRWDSTRQTWTSRLWASRREVLHDVAGWLRDLRVGTCGPNEFRQSD
jgi:hypothetical protein